LRSEAGTISGNTCAVLQLGYSPAHVAKNAWICAALGLIYSQKDIKPHAQLSVTVVRS
jgi:hypothetical protein